VSLQCQPMPRNAALHSPPVTGKRMVPGGALAMLGLLMLLCLCGGNNASAASAGKASLHAARLVQDALHIASRQAVVVMFRPAGGGHGQAALDHREWAAQFRNRQSRPTVAHLQPRQAISQHPRGHEAVAVLPVREDHGAPRAATAAVSFHQILRLELSGERLPEAHLPALADVTIAPSLARAPPRA